MYRIIGADQKEYGPVSVDQIKQWLAQGRLTAASKAQAEGSSEWKPLAEIAELAEILATLPPRAAATSAGENPPAPSEPSKTSGLAIGSLVSSIAGVFTCGVGGLVGLILGIIALVRINKSGGALRGRGLAVAGIVVAAVSLLILPALLLPALSKAKTKAQAISCMTNLKQLGLGIQMYATDNQNQFPPAANWCDAIRQYVGSEQVFKCLAAEPGQRSYYAYNSRLVGIPISGVHEPMRTVLAFEFEGGWNVAGGPELLPPKGRHAGAIGVVFVDGHSEIVMPKKLANLRWDP